MSLRLEFFVGVQCPLGWGCLRIVVDGLPFVSYYQPGTSTLNVLHCGSLDCTSGDSITTVDSNGDVGRGSSVTIGVDGLPLISYYDATSGHLKVVHCADAFCVPYFRRR